MAKSFKNNKRTKNNRKSNKKRNRKYKGGAEYYAPVGDPDRDSVDSQMEKVLGRIGVSNSPEGEQSGWLPVGILGIIGIGGIGYLLLKGRR
jgi:hypothetical protein